MDLKNKKILIEGIGGIGGIIASRLLAVGFDCSLVTGNQEITKKIQTSGITEITGEKQIVVSPKHVYTSLADIEETYKFDFALLAMKAESVVEAAKLTIPHLFSHGFVVTFQNGIVEGLVLEEIDRARLISGVMAFGSTMVEHGVYQQTSPGSIFIGELNGEITNRLTQLGEILQAVLPVNLSENIVGVSWTKLAINATANALGAISGQTWGEILDTKPKRMIFLKVYSEVVNVSKANNIKLGKITTNPLLLYLPEKAGFFKRLRKDLLLRIAARKYKNIKSSSLQSLLRGRKTEIDYLNGFVVSESEKNGLYAPVNKILVDMVKEIENGKREIDPKNIDEITQKLNLQN
ncbi:MAG: ketopantoate reductase family protein [Candidatus Kariarchaeaceae archaeon]